MKKVIYIFLVLSASIAAQTNTENYIHKTIYNTEVNAIPTDYDNFSISSGISDFLINGNGGGSFSASMTDNVLSINFSGGWNSGELKLGRAKVLPFSTSHSFDDVVELGDLISNGKPNGFKAKLRGNELILYSNYFVGGIITNTQKQIPGNGSYTWEHISLDGLVAKCPTGNRYGQGHLIIKNDGSIHLNVEYNANFSGASNCAPYLGVVKTLTGQSIPDMDLGAFYNNSGDETVYRAKIKNNRLIFYSKYFIKGVSTSLSKQIPNSTLNYSASLGNPYECPNGGGGGGSSSISITNGLIRLSLGAGWDGTCRLKLGQIKQLSTSAIPDMELGTIVSNFGDETIYKAKIENNWLVYYSDEFVPVYPTGGRFGKTIDFNVPDESKIETISYFDGLGRPKQNIALRAGGQKQDIITHFDYDNFGRQDKEFLPYAKTSQGGKIIANPQMELSSFYNTVKYENTTNAFTEIQLENSPLNRSRKRAAPGEAWKMGNGHEIEFGYETNSFQEVRKFEVNFANNNTKAPQLVANTNSYYNVGELFKNVTYDENHLGTTTKDHSVEEFTDKLGRMILKRSYDKEVEHDTYYVYDDFNNLTYVIPPKVTTNNGVSSTELAELCYQYKYDERNRLIEKKIPGKDPECIVYNRTDQPIMTQDANLEAQSKWLFNVYDAFGRIAYTGIDENNTLDRDDLQTAANAASKQFVIKTDTPQAYVGTNVYYSKDAYPVSFDKVFTINYYDNYIFDHNVTNPGTVLGQRVDINAKGLDTGSKVRVLGTNKWITTVIYYDEKTRPIYVHTTNAYLNSIDIIETQYDFVGNVLKTRSTHMKESNEAIVTLDTFTYDHMNRLLTHRQCVGDSSLSIDCGDVDTSLSENLVFSESIPATINETASESITLSPGFHMVAASNRTFSVSIRDVGGELIASNSYDELGKLTSKKVGNKKANPLQTIDYAYNIRGWLKKINNGNTNNGDLFGFAIDYDNGTNPLYNGNIAKTSWKTANDNVLRHYNYTYDALNRITGAISHNGNFDVTDIKYDKNGNLKELKRKGAQDPEGTSFGSIDFLLYSYDEGNKLTGVYDVYQIDAGFTDGNSSGGGDYEYDANGNMTEDNNKRISDITYNHLNLPTDLKITPSSSTGFINYVYDALGNKLQKKVTSSAGVSYTQYAGNYVYKTLTPGSNPELSFLNHPEGYIEPENDGSFTYIYQYKDHLGNIRLSYKDENGNSTITTDEIVEEKNYYPFGMQHQGYNNMINGTENNYKQYQGQEFTEDLGLNWHEWRYRMSDPAIGRFISIDPLAEDYVYNGTYNFAENKVIWAKELEGLEAWYTTTGSTNPNDSQMFKPQSGPLAYDYAVSQGYTHYSVSEQEVTVNNYNFSDSEIQSLTDWNSSNGSTINGACLACATRGSELLTNTNAGWDLGSGLDLSGKSVYDLGDTLVNNRVADQISLNQGEETGEMINASINNGVTENSAFLAGPAGGYHSVIVTHNLPNNSFSIFDQGTGWDVKNETQSNAQFQLNSINSVHPNWGSRIWQLFKRQTKTIPLLESVENLTQSN